MSDLIETEEQDNVIPFRNPLRPKLVAEQLNTALAADTLVFVAIAAEAQEIVQASEPLPVLGDPLDAEIMPALPDDWNGNGFIFAEAQSGDVLHGTPEGDIFIVDGTDGVTARGYDGGDIFLFANSHGTISAGAGGDVVDLTNFSGLVNLGADQDSDTLLVWSVGDGTTRVSNFNPETDQVFFGFDSVTSELTSTGLMYSHDGQAFMTLVGVNDILA